MTNEQHTHTIWGVVEMRTGYGHGRGLSDPGERSRSSGGPYSPLWPPMGMGVCCWFVIEDLREVAFA
eukprot:6543211-Pyramimonas_sp.AAC.1